MEVTAGAAGRAGNALSVRGLAALVGALLELWIVGVAYTVKGIVLSTSVETPDCWSL